MKFKSEGSSAHTLMTAVLDQGESIDIEAGSMVKYSGKVEIETEDEPESGGLIGNLKEMLVDEEVLFRNTFTAMEDNVEISFAQEFPGDMKGIRLENNTWLLQSECYVASSPQIETSPATKSDETLFKGAESFLTSASGSGALFIGSYGAIIGYDIDPNEELTVDSNNVIAWENKIEYEKHTFRGEKPNSPGDESLVISFTGPGYIYIQTRDLGAFISDVERKTES